MDAHDARPGPWAPAETERRERTARLRESPWTALRRLALIGFGCALGCDTTRVTAPQEMAASPSAESPARAAERLSSGAASQRRREAIQAVIDEIDRICRERTVYMVGPTKGRRLAALVRRAKPRLVVECGTALGYSGLWISRELAALGAGRLISIEVDPQRAQEARINFRKAGLEAFVEVRTGDARELVSEVEGPVDFLFLDCDYGNYFACYSGIESKLADGALLVADNVGIGEGGMRRYLDLVRSRFDSRTEWFDIDLPWAKRDAMEVSTFRNDVGAGR